MASLKQMKDWGMGIAILGIMFGVTLAVLGDVQTQFDQTNDSTAYQAVDDAISAMGEFTSWFGLIVLVIVAGVIIRLVQSGFGQDSGGGRYTRRGRA